MQNNSYQKIKIKELVDYIVDNRGRNPPYYSEDGIPVIDNFQITGVKHIDLGNSHRFIDEKVYDTFIRKYLNQGDLLITLVGNGFGNVAIAPREKSVIIQNTIGIRCNDKCLNNYLFYFLSANKNIIRDRNRGAAQPSIKVSDLTDIDIILPPLNSQKKIASILSAYDDLIENNNKRIKILEEIVLSIYKKLFQGKTENGFIKNLYSLLPGYAFKSKDFADEGDAIVKIRNINEEGMVDTENVDLIPSEITQKVEKFKLNSGDILIAMTGATIGKTGIVPILGKNTFLNQRVGKFISKKSPVYISYIASYSRMSSFRKKIEAVAMGAAQPNISGSIIENFSMYIPTETELDYFCNTTEKFYREMLILRHKNTILKRIKNLLLPKLISGELDVEGLDIKIRPEIL